MARNKGMKIKHGQFSEKQYIMPDGRKMEEIPMEECAIHNDDAIVSKLAAHVITQAVQDWHKLNKGGRKETARSVGQPVWRYEIALFFNSSFFAEMMAVIMPDTRMEDILEILKEANWTDRQIGMGRGKLPGTRSRRKEA